MGLDVGEAGRRTGEPGASVGELLLEQPRIRAELRAPVRGLDADGGEVDVGEEVFAVLAEWLWPLVRHRAEHDLERAAEELVAPLHHRQLQAGITCREQARCRVQLLELACDEL
jgi:hypothetical protein